MTYLIPGIRWKYISGYFGGVAPPPISDGRWADAPLLTDGDLVTGYAACTCYLDTTLYVAYANPRLYATISSSAGAAFYIFGSNDGVTWAAVGTGSGTAASLGFVQGSYRYWAVNYNPFVAGDILTELQVTTTTSVPPTATLSASPSSIISGQSSTLTYADANATSASIDHGIGAVTVNGSGTVSVSPVVTTTYTLTVIGTDGSTITQTATVTVTTTSVPPTATLTATPSALSLCVPGPALLAWTTANAASASLDNGIGTVSLSGSLPVNPVVTTTYTLTVIGTDGSTITQTATITVTPYILDTQTPDVTTGLPSWFGGKRNIAPGTYRLRYLGGAYQFDRNKGFAVDGCGFPPNMGGGGFAGFHLTDGLTASPLTPGDGLLYTVPGDAAAANAAAKLYYLHGGGYLGVYLSQQALGYPNPPVSGTTPTFEIYGPVPSATLSAFPPAVRAGQPFTLSWVTAAGNASLDNGIGAVASSGSQSVTPSVTTSYNLTCANACTSATSAATVTVVPPGMPPGLTAVSGAGGITLTAIAPPLTLGLVTVDGYQFLRSLTSGSGYAPVGTSLTPGFTDTTAAAGVLYFYICRSYSAAQFSSGSIEAASFVPISPTPPVLFLTPGNGQMLICWNAPAAFPYGSLTPRLPPPGVRLTASVFRSLTPGGEGGTPVAAGLAATFFTDPGLTNGQTYFYTVAFVNAAGTGTQSAEMSAVPQLGLGWA